jgi:hypothetical protein
LQSKSVERKLVESVSSQVDLRQVGQVGEGVGANLRNQVAIGVNLKKKNQVYLNESFLFQNGMLRTAINSFKVLKIASRYICLRTAINSFELKTMKESVHLLKIKSKSSEYFITQTKANKIFSFLSRFDC